MQALRGTKDILPDDIIFWQHIYEQSLAILTLSNYQEIRTPIIESTSLFERSIGTETDIVNKEMYTFNDQGKRSITLRPEGTACIVRALINNQLYKHNSINRLWYFGPMFRYERPQSGRQRQFHQLGIECIGNSDATADTEVIRLAYKLISMLGCKNFRLEINSIGNPEERALYEQELSQFLLKYKDGFNEDEKKRLRRNPLRILDSKNEKIQEILNFAPKINQYLHFNSLNHFENLCTHLNILKIPYTINSKLVRGLDYYNYTAFEIKSDELGSQNTICGGGRYDQLIQQLGGPNIPSVGWAIGIERLLLLIKKNINIKKKDPLVYIITQGSQAKKNIWQFIEILETHKISFELNFKDINFNKQIKKAYKLGAKVCLILGEEEIAKETIRIKCLLTNYDKNVQPDQLITKLEYLLQPLTK
uniref:histidine--tRNA ligase n=1 Tax=Gastroclonium compressum TaxID=1852973 RepID=A0A173G0A4_GASCM|nr:histidine tRNA synthetase [Coeloseira compressa]ANH09711.1 histidine tRNA synthetase [Coeloseira compressa]